MFFGRIFRYNTIKFRISRRVFEAICHICKVKGDMKRLLILISSLAIQLSVEGATHNPWPFIVIRHTWVINQAPDDFAKLMESHYRYPGAYDEFWFCTTGRGRTPEGENSDEFFVTVANIPGWQAVTLFF